MRMAMEADANTGMEDSASSGGSAQQSTNKAAEKESKQVFTISCTSSRCLQYSRWLCHLC